MNELNVLVAPTGDLAGLREILTDWSGLGLVDGFAWIEPGMVAETSIGCVLVTAGNQTAATLQSLAGRGGFERIRVCVLVPGTAGGQQVPTAVSQRVAEFLESSFGGRPVTRIRAVITRAGESGTLEGLAQGGWHNLVLAPEESGGPNQGHTLLYPTTDPFEVGRHAAAACAGILGMWHGAAGSPLDAEMPLPGLNARLVRAYYRNLDATAVELELRRQVTNVGDSLPLPSRMGASAIYIEDVALATKTMAEQLWSRHAQVLQGPREQAVAAAVRPIGAWAALRMMFGFLWAALKNAPRSWAQAVAMKIKSEAAAAVHSVVFGQAPVQYAVIVDGVTADGMPASWLNVREAATELDRVLEVGGMPREHEAHADLSALWQDYAAGALTLADAGERVGALPPVQIGTQRAIVRAPRSAVPSASGRFTDIPAHLAASISLDPVEPYDVLGIYSMEERLKRAAADPNFGVPASGALVQLQRWKQGFADSYATQVGNRIGRHLMSTTQELQSVLAQIRNAANANDSLAPILARQKKLAMWMKIILGVAVVAVVAAAVLIATAVVGPAAGIGIIGGIILAWLVGTLIMFLRGQRELFRLMHHRSTLLEGEAVARKNLGHILRDLRRLGDAYSQFLAWSHVIGTLMHEPFGRGTRTGSAKEVYVQGLPLNVKVGTAAVDAERVGMAAAELRRGIFSTGWLSKSWESALNNAPRQLGARGFELAGNPELLFRQPGDGDTSLLPSWIAALDDHGIDSSASEDMWARVVAELETTRTGLADGMISTVNEVRGASVGPTPLESFMSGVLGSGTGSQSPFDGAVLTDVARNSGRAMVEHSIPFKDTSGMSQRAGLLQLSQGIPDHEFKVSRAVEPPVWWQDGEVPGGPDQDAVMPEGPTF